MEKLKCLKNVVKPVVAGACIVAVLFTYIVPAQAASKKINLDKVVSTEADNGETGTYVIKVSQKTKIKFTAKASVTSVESDDFDMEEDEFDEADDIESLEFDDSGDDASADDFDASDLGVDESVFEFDDAEDELSEDEDDIDIDIDDDSDTPVTDEYVLISIKKGIKNVLAPVKVQDGKSKSANLTLNPGSYTITVKAVAADTIKYSFSLQDKAKYASKISVAANKTIKKGASFNLKVKGNGTFNILTYTSTNKKVAKVDKNGKVKALKSGTCKIKVKMKGVKKAAVCKLKVK